MGVSNSAFGWSSETLSGTPSGRRNPGVCASASNAGLVVFGGVSDTLGVIAETWIVDMNGWSSTQSIDSPSPRANVNLVQADSSGALLMFGGFGWLEEVGGTAPLSDTWRWDGSQWTYLDDQGPLQRGVAAMAYDTARGNVLLFGGEQSSRDVPAFGDTWIWNGSLWAEQSVSASPSPRSGAATTFDENLGQIILFGGGGECLYDDTWTWDGAVWSAISTEHSPPARTRAGLTFHEGLGATVLVGGLGAPSGPFTRGLGDTWIFDGNDWGLLDTAAIPLGGDCRSCAYSPALGGAYLFTTTGGKTMVSAGNWTSTPLEESIWAM